jgi:hypothetical protein
MALLRFCEFVLDSYIYIFPATERRCKQVLQKWQHAIVNIANDILLLRLLIGSCSVFYPVCLFFRNIDDRLSHQPFGETVQVFGFPLLAIFVS